MDWIQIGIVAAKIGFAVAFVMSIVPILIWGERKWSAYIQDRPGPNRAQIAGIRAGGLVHVLTDVVKLFMKEDVQPTAAMKAYWWVAPLIPMIVGLMTFTVVPWSSDFAIPAHSFGDWPAADLTIPMQVARINAGMLFILAFSSLSVYGIMLAGWGSNNKFSMLGGLRASAQMISYELAMGLSVVVMFLVYGTVRLDEIAQQQAGSIFNWGIFAPTGFIVGLIAFLIYWTSVLAETNRLPFDLPEGEAEIVAGYHTEYSSMRFALFFMAEYAHMIVGSTLTVTLFFGSYNIPFLRPETLQANIDGVLIALGCLGIPVNLFFAWLAWKRRRRVFYLSIRPDDPRQKEPKFWVAVWTMAALASAGLAVLGISRWVGMHLLAAETAVLLLHIGMLLVKVMFFCYVFVWIRWTLPRFRYDQLMNLGWRMMVPVAIANVLLAGIWVIIRETFLA